MKIICVSEDSDLLRQVRLQVEPLKWELTTASTADEFKQLVRDSHFDIILAGILDPHIFESGFPVIFVRNHPPQLRAVIARLVALNGHRHFPRYDIYIDGERQVASVGESRLALTLTELRLLRELAHDHITAVSREALKGCVLSSRGGRRSLDVHICSLRKKLKAAGLMIESVRGVGYRLNPCPP